MSRLRIDLNADIGESFGIYTLGHDELLLRYVTSASIACGFHAGDPSVMRATLRLAAAAGVAVGAHPGFPDLVGFGRRELAAQPQDIFDLVLYQIGALDAIARSEGLRLRHVKPHGALYNMSVRRRDAADAIAGAVAAFDTSLVLIALPESELIASGSRMGLQVAAEAFADRSYEADGSLTPRRFADAVLTDAPIVTARAVRMVREGRVAARDGSDIEVRADTICIHGDTADSATLASAVRAGLEAAGVSVAPLRA